MSEMAKKARAALRSKATKLAGETTGKVDASSFTPGAPLDADVKTGMRPISKRAFKKGGKVHGAAAKKRADRIQRKSGGKVENEKAEARDIANAKVNRNLKDANQEREGIKHIGGMKKGGRAKKKIGGAAADLLGVLSPVVMLANAFRDDDKPEKKKGGSVHTKDSRTKKKIGGGAGGANTVSASETPPTVKEKIRSFLEQIRPSEATRQAESLKDVGKGQTSNLSEEDKAAMDALVKNTTERPSTTEIETLRDQQARKRGGRTKKMDGGTLQAIGAANAATAAPTTNLVPSSVLNIQPGGARGKFMKKGGKVSHMEWEHSKKDLEQDKKLAKKHGMSMEKWEKSAADEKHDKQQSTKGLCGGGRTGKATGGALSGYADGGSPKKGKRKKDGKTHINIMIASGQPAEGAMPNKPAPGAMPPGMPPMPPGPPPGMPPMPPGGPAGGPPGMPPGLPPGMPPMPRKSGGRAKSYKDMTAGAGTGEGRLEKTEIAEHQRTGRKEGGHVYPAMKYGAGSGEGRLEKIEKYGKNAKK